jgi:hypothetical protein
MKSWCTALPGWFFNIKQQLQRIRRTYVFLLLLVGSGKALCMSAT